MPIWTWTNLLPKKRRKKETKLKQGGQGGELKAFQRLQGYGRFKVIQGYARKISNQRLQGFRSFEVTRPALPADFQRLQCYRSYGSYTWLCQKILKGYKVSEVTRLHSRLCQQIFKGYKVTEFMKVTQGYARRFSKVTRFQKLWGYTAGFASRFLKVTGLQRLRRMRRAMLEDSQRLQGFRSCEVAQSYDWRFSKVAGLRRLRGAQGYIIHPL